jgi:hypothetical protein
VRQWIGRGACGLVLVALTAGPVGAEIPAPKAAGLLVVQRELARGEALTKDYEQREVYLAWPLRWGSTLKSGWVTRTELAVTAGGIADEGGHAFTWSVGPTLFLASPKDRLSFHIGLRPTYLSNAAPGPLDLGIHIQFTSHIGVLVRIWRGLHFGWRLQHISNAGLASVNPGLNPSTAEFRVAW